MKNNFKIRFTIEEDLKDLPWLYRQYFAGDTGVETNYNEMVSKFKELSNNKDYKFVSALINDKLIGFCSIVINHDIVEKQKPIVMLWHLRVSPKYRSQGIGAHIMEFIENFAKSINADFIYLGCDKDNLKAKKFYERIGYKQEFGFYKYL